MTETLQRKDYLSGQEPRWCVGCGDYGVLKGFTAALAQLELPRENIVIVSGIGCSSRFPHYCSTYGFHGIHGRAPAIATGVKLARPELSVWVVTGDGDGLSIGGNHFLHLMRRNPNINVILLNNRIYGLTKGQISPTSPTGAKTKSTPFGSVDRPVNPIQLAIACGATFAARIPDTDNKMITEVLKAAHNHKGVSFVEVLQSCEIFNNQAWTKVNKKSERAEHTILLQHGEPLIWGNNRDKGFRFNGFDLEAVNLDDPSVDENDLVRHDAHASDPTLALKLAILDFGVSPYPLGIFRQVEEPVYEEAVWTLDRTIHSVQGASTIHDLLRAGETWTVESGSEKQAIP